MIKILDINPEGCVAAFHTGQIIFSKAGRKNLFILKCGCSEAA